MVTIAMDTTRSGADGDSCYLAKEQSWSTAWIARSLLSRTNLSSGRHEACERPGFSSRAQQKSAECLVGLGMRFDAS